MYKKPKVLLITFMEQLYIYLIMKHIINENDDFDFIKIYEGYGKK
jgi:hypothetical protein